MLSSGYLVMPSENINDDGSTKSNKRLKLIIILVAIAVIIIIMSLFYTFMSNSESNIERQLNEGCYMINSKWICPKS